MFRRLATRFALLSSVALIPAMGAAQQHSHSHAGSPPAPATLGELNFPVSCTPEAQASLQRSDEAAALLLVPGRPATLPTRCCSQDPDCVMALGAAP